MIIHQQCTGRSSSMPGIPSRKTSRKSTQNSHLKKCTSWGLRDWQPHPVWCMNAPLVDIQTCRVHSYILYIQYAYISVQYIYLFLRQWNCQRLTSKVCGMVHSDRAVVDLLHEYFRSPLSTFCKSISIVTYCMYATMSESNIMPRVKNSFTFSNYVYFSSIWIVIHQFFTWISLGLCSSLMFVWKANAEEEETRWATWLYHKHNQPICVTNRVIETSLSASLQDKTRATMDLVSHIALNQKLSRIV